MPVPPYASKIYTSPQFSLAFTGSPDIRSIWPDPLHARSAQPSPLGLRHSTGISQWIHQKTDDVCVWLSHPNGSQLQRAPSQSRWRSKRHWPEWTSFDITPAWEPTLGMRPKREWPNDEVIDGMVDEAVDEAFDDEAINDEAVDEIGPEPSATSIDR
jgi:hypothetical protein